MGNGAFPEGAIDGEGIAVMYTPLLIRETGVAGLIGMWRDHFGRWTGHGMGVYPKVPARNTYWSL